jgi:hydrogenase maturation protease
MTGPYDFSHLLSYPPMIGEPPPRALVIGIGNEYRSDDAAGLLVARRLREVGGKGIVVLEQDGDGTRLMEAWTGAALVFLVDAVYSSAPPGTVHCLEATVNPIPAAPFRHSTHAFGLVQAVELGRTLKQLPDRLVVYGIEARNFQAGTGVSHEVEQALERVVRDLLSAIEAAG